MRPAETTARIASFARRGPGTDAERRTARWLSQELESARRETRLEPFWCRPNVALAHAWHVGLGLIGSLVSVSNPRVGGVLVLIALLSILADAFLGWSPGRRLTPERASQNVISVGDGGQERDRGDNDDRVHLIITANYDAGRAGLAYRNAPRAALARIKRFTGETWTVGWLGWIVILLLCVLLTTILRLSGAHGAPVGIAQLIPTVALVLALALLLGLSSSDYGPAAGDNGSGAAVALALTRALDASPPRRLRVELVLQGAGEGGGVGLRRHLRSRKRSLTATNTVVLGIAACGAGRPRWWVSDGALVPMRYFKRLRELSESVGASQAHLAAGAHRGRGTTPALPARIAGLPAISVGCLDELGRVPCSHVAGDTADALDPGALDATLELALALVDAIDADLARRAPAAVVASA